MRFNDSAYNKLYPREQPAEDVETAVESFTPTKDETESQQADTMQQAEPQQEGVENGDAGTC